MNIQDIGQTRYYVTIDLEFYSNPNLILIQQRNIKKLSPVAPII